MRWTHFLATNADALKSLNDNFNKRIEHHQGCLEDWRLDEGMLRFHQGCVTALRQVLLDLETENRESKADGYRTSPESST